MKLANILKSISFLVFLASMILLPLVNTGCIAVAAVGAGAGAYAYLKGSLDSHLGANLNACIVAVRKSVPKTGLVKLKEVSDQTTAKFTFKDTFNTKTVIHLTQRSQGLTEISIRVGNLGEESRSLEILNQINRELNKSE